MPELPEVEIIKIFLAKEILGLRVKKVDVLNKKSFLGDPELLVGKEIKSVERRAKVLRIRLDDCELLIHLKMSGQIILSGDEVLGGGHPTKDMFGVLPNKSTRVIFELSDKSKLFFNDQRKFGWIKLVGQELSVMTEDYFKNLGPEPLENKFSWTILRDRLLRRKKTPVKVAILDQEIVAGVGNIYACEACFIAGVDPRKLVKDLKEGELKLLHKGIVEALRSGVKYGGSSKTHFADPGGKKGLFLHYAFVYGRESEACRNCRSQIKKMKLGGRGTYYCDVCQK